MNFVIVFLVLILALLVVVFFYVSSIIATPPSGRAIDFSKAKKTNRVIACIGDSLTHGNVGHCWVDDLRTQYPGDNFLNEGINGNVVWQVQQRLQPILACKPDIVILMIGSNDAMASFNKKSGERYKKNNKLPDVPTFKEYKKLLPELVESITKESKVAMCTIPPIGENPESAINQHVKKYNEFIALTAKNNNIMLLPFSDFIWDEISKRTYPSRSDYDPNAIPIIRRIYGGIFHHYVLKKTWNEIAKLKGQWILFDQIHLNERGAKILFDLIKKHISSI